MFERLYAYLQHAGSWLPSEDHIKELGDPEQYCFFCYKEIRPNGPYLPLFNNSVPRYVDVFRTEVTVQTQASRIATRYKYCKSCYKKGLHILFEKYDETKVPLVFYGDEHNIGFMETHLHTYLLSKGRTLPPDFLRFKEGKDFEEHCVFCSEQHNGIEVELYKKDGSTIATQCHCCTNCYKEIQPYEADWSKEGLFKNYEGSHIKEKMRRFVRAQYPENINEFYQHYLQAKDEDDVTGTQIFHCVFCTNMTAESAYHLIEVPVHSDHYISGGQVRVCPTCSELYSYVKAEEEIPDFIEHTNCSSCGNSYTITKYEGRARMMSEEDFEEDYLCPSCVYKNVYGGEKGFFSSDLNLRYKQLSCSHCSATFYVDLLRSRRFLHKHFATDGKSIACDLCTVSGTSPIFVTDHKNRVLRFYKKEGEIIVTIASTPGLKPSQKLTIEADLDEAVIITMRQI